MFILATLFLEKVNRAKSVNLKNRVDDSLKTLIINEKENTIMKIIKKVIAIVMATLIVFAMSMIYASAAMEVVILRARKSGTYYTASYTMTTDYYPDTTTAQVTSTISCGTGHDVYSESYGMVAFNNDPDVFFTQTSTVLSPSTSYISYAVISLDIYDVDEINYIEGYHYFEYDDILIFNPDTNTTKLFNNGTF